MDVLLSLDQEILYRIVTWLLVITGWLVVARVHETRIQKSDLQEKADKLLQLVEEVQIDAVTFYTRPGNQDGQDEERVKILARLSRIGHKAGLIVGSSAHKIFSLVAEYRKVITIEEFEDKSRETYRIGHPRISKIIDAAHSLSEEIQRSLERTVNRRRKLR